MKNSTVFLLFLLTFILGIYIYIGEFAKQKELAEKEREALRIFPFETGSVEEAGWIVFSGNGSESENRSAPFRITLHRYAETDKGDSSENGGFSSHVSGSVWKIVEPVKTPADDNSVEQALATLAESDKTRDIRKDLSGAEALTPYGLAPPRLKIWVSGKGFETDTLSFGRNNPSGDGIYVMKSSTKEVLLAPANMFDSVNLGLNELRDRHPLHFDAETIWGITISGENGKTVKVENDSGKWVVTAPSFLDSTLVDGMRVKSYLGVLSGLEGDAVIDNPDTVETMMRKKPFLSVSLDFAHEDSSESGKIIEKSPPVVLHVCRNEIGDHFAFVPGDQRLFRLNPEDVEDLDADPGRFRRTGMFGFHEDDSARIAVHTENSDFTILREESPGDDQDSTSTQSVWKVGDEKVDYYTVSRLLSALRYLRVSHFIDDNPDSGALADADLLDPPFAIFVFSSEGDTLAGLSLGGKTADDLDRFARGTKSAIGSGIVTISGYSAVNIIDLSKKIGRVQQEDDGKGPGSER